MSDRAGMPASYDEDIAREPDEIPGAGVCQHNRAAACPAGCHAAAAAWSEPDVTLLTATPHPDTTPGSKFATCQCGLGIQLCHVWLHVQTGLAICPAGAAMMTPPEPAADAFYEVTVRVRMTAAQRAEYRAEYSIDDGVADDAAGRLQADVKDALSERYWLREFATCSVSEPRVAKPTPSRRDGWMRQTR
jgi:hypothetical protein